jgi:hypothetical protein
VAVTPRYPLMKCLERHAELVPALRALLTQTLPMESISRRFYHKKLYSPMQIFYHGVYLIFLLDLLLSLY